MAVWKRGKTWIAKFQHQNRQYKREGIPTRREAVLWEAEKRQEVSARPPAGARTPSISFAGLGTEYLVECQHRIRSATVNHKAFVYNSFLRFLGRDKPVVMVSRRDISEYLNRRASRSGKKAANRDLRELKALFNWAIRTEVIAIRNPCNLIQKYPEEPYRPYVPPPEDMDKVRMAATGDTRDFIETLYHLLARKSEIVRLTWEDISLDQRWVRLWTRKRQGGELQPDYLPMNDSLFSVLRDRFDRRDKEQQSVFNFSGWELREMMPGLCKKAGVKPFGFHAIRHHVSSLLNATGKASMKQLQMLLRHRQQSTTEVYLHTIAGDLYDTIGLLDRKDLTEGG